MSTHGPLVSRAKIVVVGVTALFSMWILALGACTSSIQYAYEPIDAEALSAGPTCDGICTESASFCDLVDSCADSERPDECEIVALEVPPEGALVECAYERWDVEGSL